jgi:hypothetical protein
MGWYSIKCDNCGATENEQQMAIARNTRTSSAELEQRIELLEQREVDMIADHEQQVEALQTENERLEIEKCMEYMRGKSDGIKAGMEQAAEIAKTDRYAPHNGRRIAYAILAKIKEDE